MSAHDPDGLNKRILKAHDAYDPYMLAELYELASKQKRSQGDDDAAGFLLTQAYVFALESAHPSTKTLRDALIADGREQGDKNA